MQPSYPIVTGKPGPSPGPSPTPSSPPPSPPSPTPSSHYEKPPCQSDEASIQVQGLEGSACAPKCDDSGACPTDVPTGTSAKPKCVLQDASSGDKYCALSCRRTKACPKGATCQHIGFSGICMYDDSQAMSTISLEAMPEIIS